MSSPRKFYLDDASTSSDEEGDEHSLPESYPLSPKEVARELSSCQKCMLAKKELSALSASPPSSGTQRSPYLMKEAATPAPSPSARATSPSPRASSSSSSLRSSPAERAELSKQIRASSTSSSNVASMTDLASSFLRSTAAAASAPVARTSPSAREEIARLVSSARSRSSSSRSSSRSRSPSPGRMDRGSTPSTSSITSPAVVERNFSATGATGVVVDRPSGRSFFIDGKPTTEAVYAEVFPQSNSLSGTASPMVPSSSKRSPVASPMPVQTVIVSPKTREEGIVSLNPETGNKKYFIGGDQVAPEDFAAWVQDALF